MHTVLKAHWAVPLQQSQHAATHILKGVSHLDSPGDRMRKRPFPSDKKKHRFRGQFSLGPLSDLLGLFHRSGFTTPFFAAFNQCEA